MAMWLELGTSFLFSKIQEYLAAPYLIVIKIIICCEGGMTRSPFIPELWEENVRYHGGKEDGEKRSKGGQDIFSGDVGDWYIQNTESAALKTCEVSSSHQIL